MKYSRFIGLMCSIFGIIVPSFYGATSSNTASAGVRAAPLPKNIPVLVLAYYPRDPQNTNYLDFAETDISNYLITDMQKHVQDMLDQGQPFLADATRYHGYKDANAPVYLTYQTYQKLEYFEKMPRGYLLGGTEHRPNYGQILRGINICDYVDTHGVKEVWIYGYHSSVIVPDESKMSSKYGDVSNAYPRDEEIPETYRMPRCINSYVMYNFNYGRDVETNIHDRMHQIENAIFFAEHLGYPANDSNIIGSTFWDDFSVYAGRASLPNYKASCGNTHSPPNTTDAYIYDATQFRVNNCETWNPDDSKTTYVNANCSQWGCTEMGFYKWYMQNMPGYNNGVVYHGHEMRNWWDAIYDFNGFIDQYWSLYIINETKAYIPFALSGPQTITKPVFVYPVDGQTLDYVGSYLFKVTPVTSQQVYLWGFFQNGVMIWENLRDEGTLSNNEYGIYEGTLGHSKFKPGNVQVWVRASNNGQWTDATVITINLQ
ncbi:MAG: hypothetical protein U0074_18060 [Kouleothrix sp.]